MFFTKSLLIITTEFTRTVIPFGVNYIIGVDVKGAFKP